MSAQIDALETVGAERVFKEKRTGSTTDRPELKKMLEQLRKDDVLVVAKYDRLARNLADLISIVTSLREKGVGFRSLAEEIDTTTLAGRLIFHVFGSIAEFERERIVERTREGLAAARKRGRVGGRPPALSADAIVAAKRMRDQDGARIGEIARTFGVSVSTVRRALR